MEVVGADLEIVYVLVVSIQTDLNSVFDLVRIGVWDVGCHVLIGLILHDEFLLLVLCHLGCLLLNQFILTRFEVYGLVTVFLGVFFHPLDFIPVFLLHCPV